MPEIQNPNYQSQGSGGSGSGGDIRYTMIFTLLVLVGLLAYQYMFKTKPGETSTAGPTQSQTQSQTQQPQTAASTPSAVSAPAAVAQKATQTPVVTAAAESEIVVENHLYRIVLTNQGAQVRHWILKQYKDSSGQPLDMVQPQTAAQFGYPLSLLTYDAALTGQLNDALYQVQVNGAAPSAAGAIAAPATIAFHYAANGLDVVKTLRFDSSYVVSIDSDVTRNGAPVRALIQWPSALGDMEEFLPSSTTRATVRTPSYFAWSLNGKQDTQASKKVSGNATADGPYQYAGVMDLYFAAVFLPDAPERTSLVTLHNTVEVPSNLSDPNSQKSPEDVIGLAVGDTAGPTRLRLFAGPKAVDVLKSVHATGADGKDTGPTLEPLIQFGMWAIIAKPLYFALRFLRNLMGAGIDSWGWAIIIFTVAFNVALLPTRIVAMKSSLKMMRIQPKVDAIKKRYANLKATDPKRTEMNTEIMALYKTENVNMYGSCLPMLVPLLLLWPYFRVLQYTVELRQAHWLWLPDLAQPDPTHVLPIVIIVTMFLTQYITPSPGMDPSQRRMMAVMMPVVFGFMLWHYASGLSLYWGTGNVIMLVIQLGINRSHWGMEMHAIAARRAAKKGGAQQVRR